MKNLILSFFLLTAFSLLAQDKKIEKEERIDAEEMPTSSSFLIEKIPEIAKKLRYYYETDGEKESFEAKFKYKASIFSVEFSKDGKLQDIEVTLKEKQLPKQSLKNIETYLKENQDRYKIEKIQAQYLPKATDKNSAEELFLKSISFNTQPPDNYELIVAVKNRGKLKKFEMIFDANGQFKSKREIIRNSYDYLIF